MVYIAAIDEVFPTEAASLESAAVRGAERVERERAALLRSDGSPKYMPEEHRDREAGIIEAAVTEYDRMTGRYEVQAQTEREKAERDLATLDGADGWEKLTDAERQKAAQRQSFISEDARDGRPDLIVKQARAALAASDKAAVYLWARGLRRRVDAAHDQGQRVDPDLAGVLHDLQAVFGNPSEKLARRLELERRIEATKSLKGRVEDGRNRVNGSRAAMFDRQRQQMGARF